MDTNSIYYGFSICSEKYFRTNILILKAKFKIQQNWEPLAKKIIIPGYEEYDFFAVRIKHTWLIIEGLTGAQIFDGREGKPVTLENNIRSAAEYINKQGGRGGLNYALSEKLMKYGNTPRYKKVIK